MRQEINPKETSRAMAFELWMKGDLLPRRAEKRQGVHLHWCTPRPFRMGSKD